MPFRTLLSADAQKHVLSLDREAAIMVGPEHRIGLVINEAQARLIMVGQVPPEVREMARTAVEWEFELSKLGRSDEHSRGEKDRGRVAGRGDGARRR